MWGKNTVSVILPTYNEKDSIADVIEGYFDIGYVDEVIVVNNNAIQGTKEVVDQTRARQVFEEKQGYGFAIRRGIDEAKGDLIIISEPDGTFSAKDTIKLLAYSEDCDVVWGTRTDIRFIERGANMGILLRTGNLLVAKILQFIFNTTRLTDVGCTLKLYKREVIQNIKEHFTVGREHFGVELMVLTVMDRYNIIEIPVKYNKRVGKSSVTGYPNKTFILALKVVGTIVYYFFKRKKIKRKAGQGESN